MLVKCYWLAHLHTPFIVANPENPINEIVGDVCCGTQLKLLHIVQFGIDYNNTGL